MTRSRSRKASGSRADSALFETAESVLLRAEAAIRLLDRLAPENGPAERERLRAAFVRGEEAEPALRYPAVTDLTPVRRSLERLARELAGRDAVAHEYAERALELELEAALVAALGSPRFRELAEQRFAPARLYAPEKVTALVDGWLAAAHSPSAGERVASDDTGRAQSLVNVLRTAIGERGLPVRVELHATLAAVAAAGENVVRVRPGVLLSAEQARRIAEHELTAHVLPRLAARAESIALLRTGFRGAGDEEEGRAVLVEERGGFLDGARRRELALRHRAAVIVRSGASFSEAARDLAAAGAPVEQAVELVLRAVRGGGLGREIVYLPAYLAVSAAFAAEPELEAYFRRGRASIAGARLLSSREKAL